MTAGGRVCVMGTALGTMPSTGGGRPPAGKLTTPGGYLKRQGERDAKLSHQSTKESELWHLFLMEPNTLIAPN